MGEKINVLFLDHDGVICLPDQWGRRSEGSLEIDKYFDKFDKKSIKILNEIIEKTNCEIVISSDWRFHCKIDLKTMQTNLDGIFAAGDIVRGASLVVWAIKDVCCCSKN